MYLNKSRDLLLEADEGDVLEEMAGDEAFIPEEVMQDKEKQRLIREIIDGLSDMQRLCVMGFYYNEQSQESIAEELGIPVNTVKSHLSRARAKIKAAVQELDVKKGTRLYNITPVLLTLIEEEIKSCVRSARSLRARISFSPFQPHWTAISLTGVMEEMVLA